MVVEIPICSMKTLWNKRCKAIKLLASKISIKRYFISVLHSRMWTENRKIQTHRRMQTHVKHLRWSFLALALNSVTMFVKVLSRPLSVSRQWLDGHFPNGFFSDGHFPDRTPPPPPQWIVPRWTVPRTDSSPNGHFSESPISFVLFIYLYLPLLYRLLIKTNQTKIFKRNNIYFYTNQYFRNKKVIDME